MIAYHEVSNASFQTILKNGLKRDSRGDKGDDKSIVKTDSLLDAYCPKGLQAMGVSRDNNIYAYLHYRGNVIDITDGNLIPVQEFVQNSTKEVLELSVNPDRAFVSDLDAYDRLKKAIDARKDDQEFIQLAVEYWKKLRPLKLFKYQDIPRPELMITYDLDSSELQHR